MNEVAYYIFHCKHCPNPMWLPTEMLRREFQSQAFPSKDDASVGVLCSQCNSLKNYSLDKNSPDHSSQDCPVVALPRKQETVFLGLLRCDAENCNIPLPIFAQWMPDTTVEERKADIEIWEWDDLHCPQGHGITVPLDWPESFLAS
jgi:hypothetical protein